MIEVQDPIHGEMIFSSEEKSLLNTAAYRRLRFIKQLGFSEYSFPGATHTRFLHSLGVCHLAEKAFLSVLKKFKFSSERKKQDLLRCVRAAALLHDLGHGPLSHVTEEVMPLFRDVDHSAYKKYNKNLHLSYKLESRVSHEFYTMKFIMDSEFSSVLRKSYQDIEPIHVACLIDNTLQCPDDFFRDQGFDFQTILSQIVSSEIDVDRMDYLERDAYFCGVNYGNTESHWILRNIGYYVMGDTLHLALDRRAVYAFDYFLLSRHYLHLSVYFHHKPIIYEEMLYRYLRSKDCNFQFPSDIEEYTHCTDQSLYQHIKNSNNSWARRIAEQRPYVVAFEQHAMNTHSQTQKVKVLLEEKGIETIYASSSHRLSKYHSPTLVEKSAPIFVIDQYDSANMACPLEKATEVFKHYEDSRWIERIYVDPRYLGSAKKIIDAHKKQLVS